MAIYYAAEIVLFAFIFYGVTLWIYDVIADRDPLRTYLWNIALIALVLLTEQVTTTTIHTREAIERSSRSSWGKIRLGYMIAFGLMSVKPALYLFYLVALVVSRISALEPTAFSSNIATYLSSIEGSLLLLVVFDKLVDVVKKDYTITAELTFLAARAFRSRPDSPPTPDETTDRPR